MKKRALATTMAALVLPLSLGLSATPALAFDAKSPTGVDVSKWQRPGGVAIDWNKVVEAGEQFAFIKATDGIEGRSIYFEEDAKKALDAGLIVGSYHKAHPDRSAVRQADDYAAALALLPQTARTLPPVLDIELDNGLTPAQLEAWVETFLERLEETTGEKPMIYTFRWFWQVKMANSEKFTDYPLWLAAYQEKAPEDIIGGWDKLTFWQYANNGRVSGIPTIVDRNRFNGSEAELQGFVSGIPGGTGDAAAPVSPDAPAAQDPVLDSPRVPELGQAGSVRSGQSREAEGSSGLEAAVSDDLVAAILDLFAGKIDVEEFFDTLPELGIDQDAAAILREYAQRAVDAARSAAETDAAAEYLTEMADAEGEDEANLGDVTAVLAGVAR